MSSWLRLEHGGLVWQVRSGEETRICSRDWTPPADDAPGVKVVQRWGSRVSALCAAAPGEEGDLFVKWYGPRHAAEGLKFAVTESRPEAEWRVNRMLVGAGVPVVECLAMGERRTPGRWWRSGVLVLKAVTPAVTLGAYLKSAPGPGARAVVGMAADLVSRMHALGCCHHDLHGENVLVRQEGGRPVGLLLADLHETTRHRPLDERRWMDDLARLNGYTPADRAQRLRFWFRYASARGLAREEFRRWIGGIDRRTKAMWERHFQKRGTRIELY